MGTTLGQACSRGYRERKVRSKIGWLAGSRDSHHVSRFAAFFILARAEISVDGSCFGVSRFALFFMFPFSQSSPKGGKKKREQTLNASFSISSLQMGDKGRCLLSGVSKGRTPPLSRGRRGGDSHISHQGHARLIPPPKERKPTPARF